jgi:hypothetical protein
MSVPGHYLRKYGTFNSHRFAFIKRLEAALKKQLVFDESKQLRFEVPNERIKYVESRFTNEETHHYKKKKIEKRLQGLHRFLQINLAGAFFNKILSVARSINQCFVIIFFNFL